MAGVWAVLVGRVSTHISIVKTLTSLQDTGLQEILLEKVTYRLKILILILVFNACKDA